MINLCLVVIATQFSETKKREMERMRLERARYQSTSTLASTSASESQSCYKQIIKYIAHLWRRSKRRLLRRYRAYRNRKRHDNVPRPLSLRKRTGRPKTSSAGQSCHVMIFLRFSLKCSSRLRTWCQKRPFQSFGADAMSGNRRRHYWIVSLA